MEAARVSAVNEDAVAIVRAMWVAYEREGLEASYALVDDDVEWALYSANGRVLRGPHELREHFAALEREGRSVRARATSIEVHGDCVLVRGKMRIEAPGRIAEQPMAWLYRTRGGRIVRIETHRTPADALAAATRPIG
jgi:ketosteroid isomerase-like protein